MILEDNPGMPRNPRAVGFGSHERKNVVPLLRKPWWAPRQSFLKPADQTRMVVDYPMRIWGGHHQPQGLAGDPAVGRVNRKVNMLATSLGAPILPKGCMFLECSNVRSEAVILEANGVSTRPGALALIRMPLRA